MNQDKQTITRATEIELNSKQIRNLNLLEM